MAPSGLAGAVIDSAFGGDRKPFRRKPMKAIAAQPAAPAGRVGSPLNTLAETLPGPPIVTERNSGASAQLI
jgi:hypothetical protein